MNPCFLPDTNSSESVKTMEAGESREIPSAGEVGSLRQAQKLLLKAGGALCAL